MNDIHLPHGATLTDGGQYDAGHGFRYTPYYRDETLAQLDGIWFWHPCSLDTFRGRQPGANGRTDGKWEYTNTDDPKTLTIRASILCDCGFHGFLTNGRWESC